MTSTKKDEAKVSTDQFKESTDRYLEQQVKDTTSNVSQTTEKIKESVNKFQDDNRRNVEKNADTFRKYQGQISTATQEMSINNIELQKNICNTVHSSYVQFLDNISKSSENFKTPEKWYEIYNPFNLQEYIVNIPNSKNFINESIVSGVENLNKMIELSQRFYSELVQNNFNLARKTKDHI